MNNLNKLVLFALLIFGSTFLKAQSININATDYKQAIDMIGGDMERSSMSLQGSVKNKEDVLNWGFRDVNFNYCRVQFDKNQELIRGQKNWEFYERQVITMQEIKERKPNIKFYATMRTDYDGFGDNNNMPDWIVNYNTRVVQTDEYATFLADYLEFMMDEDVTIHTLALTKEWAAFVTAEVSSKIINKLISECNSRGIPMPEIIDPGTWGIAAGINFMNDVEKLGTKDLYYAFSAHDYGKTGSGTGSNNWSAAIDRANSLGKKMYDDETSVGTGPTSGEELDLPTENWANRCITYESGLSGEVIFEIWSRGINRETRAIYWPWGGTARRLRGYYMMRIFVNNVVDSRYVSSTINSASGISTMTFRKGNQINLWVVNEGNTTYNGMNININNAQINGNVASTYWTNESIIEGVAQNISSSNTSFSTTIRGTSVQSFIFNVADQNTEPSGYDYCSNERGTCTYEGTVNIAYGANGSFNYLYNQDAGSTPCDNATFGDPIPGVTKSCYVQEVVSSFTPNPNRTYYIDVPVHNLRLAATGEAEDAYTTSTTTTGDQVEWQFVDKGNGSWHVQLAADVSKPRLRTRSNGGETDMQATSSDGIWTYWDFTQGSLANTYFFTLPDGPEGLTRLQIDREGDINMVPPSFNGTWESFRITEAGFVSGSGSTVVHITNRNNPNFALDGNHAGANGQDLYLWGANQNNTNQQWIEIDRGNGYYTYQKMGTNFCIDGNGGGATAQNVYLWTCSDNNQNQHWKKVATTGGSFRLEKRNSAAFSIDAAGANADNGQSVYLWGSNNNNANQQWFITPVGTSAKSLDDIDSNGVVIYPNPVISTAIIQGAANSTINVYNMNGSVLLSKNVLTDKEALDLSSLPTGIYYAQVKGIQSLQVIKIIKQ